MSEEAMDVDVTERKWTQRDFRVDYSTLQSIRRFFAKVELRYDRNRVNNKPAQPTYFKIRFYFTVSDKRSVNILQPTFSDNKSLAVSTQSCASPLSSGLLGHSHPSSLSWPLNGVANSPPPPAARRRDPPFQYVVGV